MTKIYFIGGSPCSGKSTVAEIISSRYGWYYFKVDDYLDKYMNQGSLLNYEICRKLTEMNSEQIWMREPALQCKEEIIFYEEIFDFIMQDLEKLCDGRTIITEGAAYLPHLMKKLFISKERYIAITPTREFQISHYKERDWIHYVLEGCKDKKEAFDNWMDRDCLFADNVNEKCKKTGYFPIINDGKGSIDDLIDKISAHFELVG